MSDYPKFQWSKMYGDGEQIVVREESDVIFKQQVTFAKEMIATQQNVKQAVQEIKETHEPEYFDDQPDETTCKVHNKTMKKYVSKKGAPYFSHSAPLKKDADGNVTEWKKCFGRGWMDDTGVQV